MIDHRHHFDEEAAEWDKDPKKIERARRTAQLIVETVKPAGTERAFAFGAGTGLASQFLAPSVGSLTLADNSHGMREVMTQKIEAGILENAERSNVDLYGGVLEEEKADILVRLLLLCHGADFPAILRAISSMLCPGGVGSMIDLGDAGGDKHAHING